MATPPTRVLGVSPSAGWASTANPKTSPAFDVQAGDLLVYTAFSEDFGGPLGAPTWTGTGTLTLVQSVVVSNYSTAYMYVAAVTVTQTGRTVSVTRSGNPTQFSFILSLWRNHGGVGVSGKANASGAPSLVLNAAANSALVMGNSDWNAADGATRTWRAVNGTPIVETSYGGQAGISYTNYTGYTPDVGAAGSKTVGLTVPSGQKYSIIGVEILGVAGSTPNTGATTGSFTVVGSATGVRASMGAAAGAVSITGSATGERVPKGATVAAFTVGTAAEGVRRSVGIAVSPWSIAASVSGKRAPVGTASISWATVGSAVGIAPTTANDGSAVGVWQFSGVAVGVRASRGATAALWGIGSIGAGTRSPVGMAAGQWSVLASAMGGSDLRNVTVVVTLNPRTKTGILTDRTKTGTLQSKRWAGTL